MADIYHLFKAEILNHSYERFLDSTEFLSVSLLKYADESELHVISAVDYSPFTFNSLFLCQATVVCLFLSCIGTIYLCMSHFFSPIAMAFSCSLFINKLSSKPLQ